MTDYLTIHPPYFMLSDKWKIGYGVLTDAVKCTIKERLNGDYYLSMKYPVGGQWAEYIKVKNIIHARANYEDDRQAFRIIEVSETIDGFLDVVANHITYDLNGVPVSPFKTTYGVVSALLMFNVYAQKMVTPFSIITDKTTEGTFVVDVPSSIRSWFGGKEGSIIDVFRGEWHFDNEKCKLLNHRGSNKGVTIRYAKNLLDFEKVDNDEDQYTAIWAYYKFTDEDSNTHTVIGDIIETGATGFPINLSKVLCLDATSHFNESEPTAQQLNEYATSYMHSNNIDKPKEKLSASFVPTDDIVGNIAMGDTITVVHKDVTFQARIKETTWDVLQEKFTDVKIGDIDASLASSISNAVAVSGGSIGSSGQANYSKLEVYDIDGKLRIYGDSGGIFANGYPQTINEQQVLSEIFRIRALSNSDAKFTIGTRSGDDGAWSSVIGGKDAEASGENSLASGYKTVAKGQDQTVIGRLNVADDNNKYALIIGGGNRSNDNRANLLTIGWDGEIKVLGHTVVSAGGTLPT